MSELPLWLTSSKDPIGRDRSYPFTAMALAEAFAARGVATPTQLVYSPGNFLIYAWFWPPNPNVAWERFYIQVGSVERARVAETRSWMKEAVLPELADWARAILDLPDGSPRRREKQHFARDGGRPNFRVAD